MLVGRFGWVLFFALIIFPSHCTWTEPKKANTTSEPKKVATPTNTKAARSKVALSSRLFGKKVGPFCLVSLHWCMLCWAFEKKLFKLSLFFVFWWIDSYTLHPSTLRVGIFLNFVKLFKVKIWWESWKANWRPPWPSRPESCNWLGSPNSCWEAGGMWICDVFTVIFCDFCQWFCFFLLNAGFVLLAVLASEIFADRVAAKFHMKTYLWVRSPTCRQIQFLSQKTLTLFWTAEEFEKFHLHLV